MLAVTERFELCVDCHRQPFILSQKIRLHIILREIILKKIIRAKVTVCLFFDITLEKPKAQTIFLNLKTE